MHVANRLRDRDAGGTKCNGHKRKNIERTRDVRLPFEAGNVRGYS